MPRENRLIVFDHGELYHAIYSLCSNKGLKMPPQGNINKVSFADSNSKLIVIDIENNLKQVTKQEEYGRDFIAAALMLLCRGLGIPLPKVANKAVSIVEGKIALRIKI